MHFGIIAGRVSLDAILQAFHESGAELLRVKPLERLEDAPQDRSATYIIAGEHAGSSYLIDESMLLSAGQADLLAAVADRTGALVVGCGAETVSGTFWFSAFNGRDLLRIFWMCRSDLAAPFSDGRPFQSEATHPLDMDWDGDGIFAALGELGFEYNSWLAAGPYQLLVLEKVAGPTNQPLEDALTEHSKRHQLASDERPGISVVQRPPVSIGPSQSPSEPGLSVGSGKRTLWQRAIQSLRRR
jgi:hypothetical protein